MNLDLQGMSQEAKTRAKNVAGEIIVDKINEFLGNSETPVMNGKYKTKKADGSNSTLLDTGDMRFSLEAKNRKGNQIEVGVFKKRETAKAYGHNTGFKGHKSLANKGLNREFIPDKGEVFKKAIMNEVNDAIADIKEFDEFRKEQTQTDIKKIFNNTDFIVGATATNDELQAEARILIGELFGDFFGDIDG